MDELEKKRLMAKDLVKDETIRVYGTLEKTVYNQNLTAIKAYAEHAQAGTLSEWRDLYLDQFFNRNEDEHPVTRHWGVKTFYQDNLVFESGLSVNDPIEIVLENETIHYDPSTNETALIEQDGSITPIVETTEDGETPKLLREQLWPLTVDLMEDKGTTPQQYMILMSYSDRNRELPPLDMTTDGEIQMVQHVSIGIDDLIAYKQNLPFGQIVSGFLYEPEGLPELRDQLLNTRPGVDIHEQKLLNLDLFYQARKNAKLRLFNVEDPYKIYQLTSKDETDWMPTRGEIKLQCFRYEFHTDEAHDEVRPTAFRFFELTEEDYERIGRYSLD